MERESLRRLWKQQEQCKIIGWDFGPLVASMREEPLPWNYRNTVLQHLKPTDRLLDMGTGGGEFLMSLSHPPQFTAVTEGYAPNLALCRSRLAPLGIRVEEAAEDDKLPFPNESFDLIINRHDSFDVNEVARCLKRGGKFITQQVGGENNAALSRRLLPGYQPPYAGHDLASNVSKLEDAGLKIREAKESFPKLCFTNVSALVVFAHAIPWEFPGFNVDACFEQLLDCHREIEQNGELCSREHRFFILSWK